MLRRLQTPKGQWTKLCDALLLKLLLQNQSYIDPGFARKLAKEVEESLPKLTINKDNYDIKILKEFTAFTSFIATALNTH